MVTKLSRDEGRREGFVNWLVCQGKMRKAVSKMFEQFYMVGSIPSVRRISLDRMLLISTRRCQPFQNRNKWLVKMASVRFDLLRFNF